MIRMIALAVWLLGAPGPAMAEQAAGAADTAGIAAPDTTVRYRAAEPVVTYVERTRPGEAPAPVDRFHGLRERMVDAVLVLAGGCAVYLVIRRRRAARKVLARERMLSSQGPRARTVPDRKAAAPKLPSTAREWVAELRERRAAHAAEIERLLKRL